METHSDESEIEKGHKHALRTRPPLGVEDPANDDSCEHNIEVPLEVQPVVELVCCPKDILQTECSHGSLLTTSNEMKISHGRVSWQTHSTYFVMGPLASSIG
jgi:hypothetical protein